MKVRTRVNKWMLAQWSLDRKRKAGGPILIESPEEMILVFGQPNAVQPSRSLVESVDII